MTPPIKPNPENPTGLANTREGQMELLPCPFCGCGRVLITTYAGHAGLFVVRCQECEAEAGTGTPEYASETWNRRAPSLPAVPDVKEEEKTLEKKNAVAANTREGQNALQVADDARLGLWLRSNLDSIERHVRAMKWGNSPSDHFGRLWDVLLAEVGALRDHLRNKFDQIRQGAECGRGTCMNCDAIALLITDASSVPEASKSSSASEFSQTSLETGGRNALNLQVALELLREARCPNPHDVPTYDCPWCLAVKALQDARAASDGKEQP